MTLRRQLSWSTSMRDLSRDRAASPAVPPMFLASMARAKAATERKQALAVPLVVGGNFDRAAIMKAALASARAERANGVGTSWSELISSGLRLAWARAKAQRDAGRI
jgi:hypothetical protein